MLQIGNAGYGYRVVLGDVRGARGQPYLVGRPTDAGGAVGAITTGESLVLVTVAKGLAPYVNVLAPPLTDRGEWGGRPWRPPPTRPRTTP